MRGKIKPGVTYGTSCFTHGQPLPLFKLAVFWSPVSRAEGEFRVRGVKGTRKPIETMDRIGCKGISREEGMDDSRLNNKITQREEKRRRERRNYPCVMKRKKDHFLYHIFLYKI